MGDSAFTYSRRSMSVSHVVEYDLLCSRCQTSSRVRLWRVIDLEERPDLRSMVADGSWRFAACTGCSTEIEHDVPLLVLHLAGSVPIVLGVPEEALVLEDPVAPESDLLEHTRAALGSRLRDVPGPVLAAPFDVVKAAAGRDLDADVTAPSKRKYRALGSRKLARRYRIFLNMARESSGERRVNLAMNRHLSILSIEDLRAAFVELPELAGEAVDGLLTANIRAAEDPEELHVAEARANLIRTAAKGHFEDAWAEYEIALQTLAQEHVGPRAESLMKQLQALDGKDARAVVALGEELLLLVEALGSPGFTAQALLRTAAGYYADLGHNPEESLERVIELCQQALDTLDTIQAEDEDHRNLRIQALHNMGAAFSRRSRGDPEANHERGCSLQRQVLAEVTLEADGRVWAMANTNLGMSLVHRALELRPGSPEREGQIAEAVGCFERALEWRSFDRDPLDWAFTQSGLGIAIANHGVGDRRENLMRAIEYHRESARGFSAAGNDELQAQALYNIACEKLMLAQDENTPEDERTALLRSAQDDTRRSLDMRPLELAPVDAGRTWDRLAKAKELCGDTAGAMVALKNALVGMTPQTAPQGCRQAARELAHLATDAEDWEAAAGAWEIAVEAAVVALEYRADTGGRFTELGQQMNLFRWASYALLRANRPTRAVEVLEQGRARELAVWLQRDVLDIEELRNLDPQLSERFLALRHTLDRHERDQRAGTSPESSIAAKASEDLRRTVSEIRALPGMDRFLLPRMYEDIAAGVPRDEALAYLLTAPEGSAIVVIRHRTQPHVIDLPQLSSRRALEALLKVDHDTRMATGGYMLVQAQGSGNLDDAITDVSAILGPELLQPLAEHLASEGVHTVCLVPAGLLGLVPLHALGWERDGHRQCLIDQFDIAVVPSALAREVCRSRASERSGDVRLLTVGNPLPHPKPLPYAAAEAAMVAETLPATEVTILIGTDATKGNVIDALSQASHIHLACHGAAASTAELLDSGLYFACDDVLTAAELFDLPRFEPRLVVASACETGINPGYESADEALALSTVVLGAGAAGVVASLWAVSDLATALLMSRFYEDLAAGATPEHALRQAQLWLRDLEAGAVAEYVRSRPALRAYRGLSNPLADDERNEAERPFAAPRLWAAFVFSGA